MNNRYLFGISILFSLLLGALAMWGYQTHARHTAASIDGFGAFDPLIFSPSPSPFANIEGLSKHFDQTFGQQSAFPDSDRWFDSWFDRRLGGSFHGPAITTFRTEEDARHLYYKLDTEGKQLSNFEVETTNGYISINAELHANSGNLASSQMINQRFPIPANVDPNSLHVEQLDEELEIRFTKQG